MEKSNIITRIIKKFLSGRFSVETEEKVQRWIMKEENAEEKEKASLEYWDHKEWTDENGCNNALRINGLGAPRAFFTQIGRASCRERV